MPTPTLRPLMRTAALACGALLIAGCSSGPLTKLRPAKSGPYFQYLSQDEQVVAEYSAGTAATCREHLANLKRGNTHGGDATRCSPSSAASRLPVSATARDAATNTDYAFRFATLEQCQRMMPAIVTSGATLMRDCQ